MQKIINQILEGNFDYENGSLYIVAKITREASGCMQRPENLPQAM